MRKVYSGNTNASQDIRVTFSVGAEELIELGEDPRHASVQTTEASSAARRLAVLPSGTEHCQLPYGYAGLYGIKRDIPSIRNRNGGRKWIVGVDRVGQCCSYSWQECYNRIQAA